MSFEVRYNDLGGRIGRIETRHGTVETPVFIPVIHPVKQIIDIDFIKKIGFKAVITNAYIALKYYGDEARKKGIHRIINFDGTVMTDSGGYQVLEYGDIDVKPFEMAKFEIDLKTDIAVPLDKPTGYGLEYKNAVEYVNQTIKNVVQTSQVIKENNETGIIWAGPVQGAEHLDLITHSAKVFDEMNFKLMALGSPVELMEAYEFATLAQIIRTLKKAIPSKPIHLFGAGHPLTLPLAVALGCDMFDSASYILYAKDNRYMHLNGTTKLEDISYFSCSCPICNNFTPNELLSSDETVRIIELSKHNLYVLKTEVNIIKQSIIDGRLWEYIMMKARSHPKLMDAIRLLKNFDYLEDGTPMYKERAIYFSEPFDQYRPEAKRFRTMALKFTTKKSRLLLHPEANIHPFFTSSIFTKIKNISDSLEIFSYNPYLGIIPAEVSDIFPASQNLNSLDHTSKKFALEYPTFVDSLRIFLHTNRKKEIILVANNFMKQIIIFVDQQNGYKLENLNNVIILDHNEKVISHLIESNKI